jgi:hypothetical protein
METAMRNVLYFDECGFTGENLADEASPVFVVGSHDIPEADALEWKARFFGHVRSTELKHSHLQRRSAHQNLVLRFVDAILAGRRAKTCMAHNPFALVAKLVDWLIEPVMHADGLDLYARGGNAALSNLLYFSLLAAEPAPLRSVIESFQKAARTRELDDMLACNEVLLSSTVKSALEGLPDFFTSSIARAGLEWVREMPPRALSISVPIALAACYAWRAAGVDSFDIVHDRSSAMALDQEVWNAILSPEAPSATIGHSHFQVTFPIGVGQTLFKDSTSSSSLQLADVLAGAVARWATWVAKGRPGDDGYAARLDEVIVARGDEAIDVAVWPIPSVTPRPDPSEPLVDPLDYMTMLLRRKRGAAPQSAGS